MAETAARSRARIVSSVVPRIEPDAAAGDPLAIPESQVEITAVRAQGAGGQNVNKVSNAVHLRFDVLASTLPDTVKQRLLRSGGQHLTREGVVVIKAQQHRSLELNRTEALAKLDALVRAAAFVPKRRKPTRPTRASRERRLEGKGRRAETKSLRGRVRDG